MFSSALQTVDRFTFPVVLSIRNFRGDVATSIGTFIVINEDGWIATAAHMLAPLKQSEIDEQEIKGYNKEVARIESDGLLNPKQKRNRIAKLHKSGEWLTNNSYLWGRFESKIEGFMVDEQADFGIGKLEPFDPSWVLGYPVFKNPAEPMLPGTSLCRLGFPFSQIGSTFDPSETAFTLASDPALLPRFPNDGMHTRVMKLGHPDGRIAEFLETNTPGLKGQSGGPLFDKNGHVWGLQSRTTHLNLGFDIPTKVGHADTTLPQYLHVGHATHVKELIKAFDHFGLRYQLSSKAV